MCRSTGHLCLQKGEVVQRESAPRGIACRQGKLWITQTGLGGDVILEAGQTFQPLPTGRLVIEALESSCLSCSPWALQNKTAETVRIERHFP